MGSRKFIPAWQVDKLEKRQQLKAELIKNAPVDS